MATKRITDKELAEARNRGRDEGAAWAVATMVMELAQAWGMKRLLVAADETDLPHLKKLIKAWPGKFPRYRAALRQESNRKGKGVGK